MSERRIHRAASDDGTKIAGRVHGEGPPLVLVPGALSDGEFIWDSLLPVLTSHFTCYAMSTRGRGLNGDSDDHSTRRLVEDVRSFAQSIGEPVRLLGWSGGGRLSLGAAAGIDDAISALAVYEPPVFEVISPENQTAFAQTVQEMAQAAADGRYGDAARQFINMVSNDEEREALSTDDADGFTERLFESLARNVPVQMVEFQQVLNEDGASPTAATTLEQIEAPVLVMCGTESTPPGWFAAGAVYVAEHVYGARVCEISGAGHLGPMFKRDAVVDEMVNFFAEQGPAR